MNQTICVFDIETDVDRDAVSRAYRCDLADVDNVLERPENSFPKLICHPVVAIGALRARLDCGAWSVDAFGAPHAGMRSE